MTQPGAAAGGRWDAARPSFFACLTLPYVLLTGLAHIYACVLLSCACASQISVRALYLAVQIIFFNRRKIQNHPNEFFFGL